jgi:Mce-associated membrane protein
MAGDDPDDPDDLGDEAGTDRRAQSRAATSPVRAATIAGVVVVVALAALAGWLGFRAHQSARTTDQRALFLQVGRQGAVDLTVFDYDHVDDQVQRTLDIATGKFYDDFQRRAPAFIELVKQIKSTSQGTVTEAGVESQTSDAAKLLVAVLVKSQIAGQPQQQPKLFRMRLSVQAVDGGAKISDVEFVA